MTTIEERLAAKGIQLPEPRPPAGTYTPVVIDGDIAYTSGLVAVENGEIVYKGRLGEDLSLEDGQKSARGACLLTLGTLSKYLGGLDRIERVLKTVGYVRATPDYETLPATMDGASELLVEVFGEAGRSARTTVGVAALPFRASVELDMVVRLRPS
jgi:enamine deaminase RidA (YjgF/YER057c/UK114 family)